MLPSSDKTKLIGVVLGNNGLALVKTGLVDIHVGPILKENKTRSNAKKLKRNSGKASKEKIHNTNDGNLLRKRRALDASSQSATKKIRDGLEIEGEMQTKGLAEVGSSQPRQSL